MSSPFPEPPETYSPARCIDCGERAVRDHVGAYVIRHAPHCCEAEPGKAHPARGGEVILTRHELTITATCPEDGSEDTYAVTVGTRRTIHVEDILAAVRRLTEAPIYQEALTRELAERLQTRVVTVGEHSGVTTTCEAAW